MADVRATAPSGSYFNETSYSVPTSGAVVASAIIQAGGAVNITATQSIENSVVREYAAGVGQIGSQNTDVGADASTTSWAITSQLPPELAQKQVDPLSLPGFSLPTGENGLFRLSGQGGQNGQQGYDAQASQAGENRWVGEQLISGGFGDGPLAPQLQKASGLPTSGRSPGAHKYLIETNPALTNLKQFMGSDYLLGLLGYDPDQAQKRLGDGLYEQHLIRQAIVERTGQRYLAGLYSDEAMFRYLMDNAVASKERLGLSLGVSLSTQQVAALTHDIVWMEERIVAGEKVLVPVLYLAQAEGRLAGNGALIQGSDLNLISGGDLNNVGTLRASGNLNATVGNFFNGGLMEAGERLQLLATESIRNAQGGIINGRDVSLTALTGDVINERSVTTVNATGGGDRLRNDIVNNAARIEAAGNLAISAGRDIHNLGSTIQVGGDARLDAGRDLVIASQAEVDTYEYRRKREQGYDNRVTQHGAEVTVGGNLSLSAQQDGTVIASQIKAGGDVEVAAGGDLTIASAANEQHQYSYRKQGKTKTTRQLDAVEQQGSLIESGGSVDLSAGENLVLVASDLKSGQDAYLVAGDKLELLAANDSDYSLYDMQKKGSFGSKKTQRDEVTDVRAVGSSISAGSEVALISGGDQLYQGARLESGGNLTLASGGAITFEAVKDLHQESHEKSKGDLAWQSAKGQGQTDETLRQSQLIAQGQLAIHAAEGLNIDIKHIDQKTVSQTIDAMVQADPQLAWLKAMEQRGDVDWSRVKEVHDSFKYSHSGLGAGAQLAIAIIVTYFTAGAASGAIASAGAGTSMAGATAAASAGASAGWLNAAGTAIASGMASNGAISTINNRGNLGAVLDDVTASDAMRGYAVAGITAGLTAGVYDDLTRTQTGTPGALQNSGQVIAEGGLSTWSGVGQFTANQLLQNGTSTLVDRALGGDSQLSDALQASLANSFAAAGFNLVGDLGKDMNLSEGGLAKVGLHALMGGLAAEAAGGDFRAGALAAGVNEALVDSLAQQYAGMSDDKKQGLLVMNSQLIGVLAAAAQSGSDAESVQTGAWVAGNATQYNYLSHPQEQEKEKELEECGGAKLCRAGTEAKWAMVSAKQDLGLAVGVGGGIGLSAIETVEGLYQLMTHLPETMDALQQLADSPEFRQQFGDSYFSDLEQRAALLTQAYNEAGWDGSITAGVEGGRFAAELVGILTAVRGTAQVTAELPLAAKRVVNALAEAPAPSGWKAQVGAVGDLSKLEGPGGAKATREPLIYSTKPGHSVSPRRLR